ncbi:hypothetical protein [Mesorhizobium sp.]|uniref:hypothetical protein n=1 Tax=Mesorhizobium sp. TaxID=1871066 RepID=UPI000FE6835A|nr:hypothetical protein [Mesorhizobium sp.]RWM17822.1 MAG: hypothetical protein EOR74_33235 [Mesorhizobium sp.]
MAQPIFEYYHPAFFYLHESLKKELHAASVTTPTDFRRKLFKENLPIGIEIGADGAWETVKGLLDIIEHEIASSLRKRSVFFWMHLYRRIGVMLSPEMESNTDPRTVALVRNVVELAIRKHGDMGHANEFVQSDRVNPDLILGGWMKRGVKQWMAASRPNRTYRNFVQMVRAQKQLVVRDFNERDLIEIYRVEGLAYQYWQVSALLRTLGKGGRIVVSVSGDWHYVSDPEFAALISSIDDRTASKRATGTLLGTWVDAQPAQQGPDNFGDRIVFPIYNANRISIAGMFEPLGLNLAKGSLTNFLPFFLNARGFLDAHGFLFKAFEKRFGYGLDCFVSVIWGLANIALVPNRTLMTDDEAAQRKILRETLLRMLQRGYLLYPGGRDDLVADVTWRIGKFGAGIKVSEDEVGAALQTLILSEENRKAIGLWSGGPRYLAIPLQSGFVLDLQGVPALLQSLFVRLTHDQSSKGTVFEEAFRRALVDRGFTVWSGELKLAEKVIGELDASVLIGDTAYFFECVSIERPLDYEIGRPITLERRRQRIEGKLDQVFGLAQHVRASQKGANYDFSGIKTIIPCVVSPFEEWLWDKSERLWISNSVPRVLSAEEAVEMMEFVRRGKP